MNSDVLECKAKAKELTELQDPPRYADGKKRGYMSVLKELWDERGYFHLGLSELHLRNQAAYLERVMGNVQDTILRNAQGTESETGQPVEEGNLLYEVQEPSINESEQATSDLHTANENNHLEGPQFLEETNLDAREILEGAIPIFASVNSNTGDFSSRDIDTRVKQRPTQSDINTINTVINELRRREEGHTLDPNRNPFGYLWLTNCILYSVVVAFLIHKGWKKEPGTTERRKRKTPSERIKEAFVKQVTEVRKKISVAVAELDRIKGNKKITNKGKKNRSMLEKECGKLSAASIVTYIERKKADLRKAKRAFMRKKKQEEARDLNTRFHADPGGVFAQFSRMVEQDADNNKPNYKTTKQTSKDEERVFESIQDACSYWKHLWETSGSTANTKPGWLVEVRKAFEKLVPVPRQDSFQLNKTKCAEAIKKKRNWSAPGPDRIANYWWKRAVTLHEGTAASFNTILTGEVGYPSWFTGGKTNLIPKPGELSSQNQRPITCLNTQYKWFTTCLLSPMDEHLETHNLLEEEQRGARTKCSGTMDNLMIDRMVCRDSRNGSRNLSMAWIDVRKAFDSVSHAWLQEMMTMHKFPLWMCRTVARLCESWNTKITARTKEGYEISDVIRFNKGLPQGDALCPRLFTLCLNPISWKLKASEGYKLSRPLSGKITHLLYIDDMKIYAASKDKLERVMKTVKEAMGDVGLEWNEKKCSTAHVRRGSLDSSLGGTVIGERQVIENLKKGETYKFLGVLENSKQEDSSVLWGASKVCLQRLSII